MSNIKELIFAEIKRLIRDPNLCSTTERRVGGHTALLKLLAVLDTLPDEPVSEDLEEAAVKYADENTEEEYHTDEGIIQTYGIVYDAFKAGAEWMKGKMMGEAYEEEVQEVYRDDDGIHCCVSVGTDYKPGIIVCVITIPKEG